MTTRSDEPKSKAKSKTIWGIVATVAGLLGVAVGLAPEEVEFLRDGIQVEDIPTIITILGTILTAYGLRAAHRPLK